jgi:hypothetical protein
MKSLCLILFVAILWNCDSEESPKLTNIEGTYSGKFSVYGPNSDFLSSEVTLIFENGGFTVTSSMERYPRICKGTYKTLGVKFHYIIDGISTLWGSSLKA